MAVTVSADIKSISQVGPAAAEIAFTQTPILAIPGLVVDVSGRIADASGETIDFPYWDTDIAGITQNAVRNSRTGVTPSKLSLKSYQETAVTKTISIDGDEFAFRDGEENHLDHVAVIVAKEFAKAIQATLITKAATTDLELDITAATTKTLNVDAILEARLLWGDHAGDLPPYLFVRTKQFSDLAKSADYKEQARSGNSALVKASEDWSKFIVGTVHGIPIVLCDSCPTASSTHTALLIGPEALGVFVADEPVSRTVNHAGSTVVTLDTHFRYADTLFRHKPRRVVKIKTN